MEHEYEVIETPIKYDDIVFPETLYKYRDWSKINNRTILTNREVFFASPKSFVDPIDCKNFSRWDLLTYEDLLNKYFKRSQEINKNYNYYQHMEWATKWANESPINNKEFVRERQEKDFLDYNIRLGVLSLTEFNNLTEMWDMYSNGHTGFCVGFDPNIMLRNMGTGGGKVRYYDELPVIYPTPKHSFSMQMNLQVFCKLKEWEFEQEYRTYKFSINPLTLNNRIQIVPPEAYKELIFGAKIPDKVVKAIIDSLPKEIGHLEKKLKRAQLIDNVIEIVNY